MLQCSEPASICQFENLHSYDGKQDGLEAEEQRFLELDVCSSLWATLVKLLHFSASALSVTWLSKAKEI